MKNWQYKDYYFSEIIEDAFVYIKEACVRLQERTKCNNDVVIKMLNDVSKFYILQFSKHRN